jgi:threonine dehydratase
LIDETGQKTRTFKARGALNAVQKLLISRPEIKEIQVASSGSFGMGIAYASSLYDLKSRVFTPNSIPLIKKNLIVKFGAEIVDDFQSYEKAKIQAKNIADSQRVFFMNGVGQDVFQGNATLIHEINRLYNLNSKDLIICPLGIGSLYFPTQKYIIENNLKSTIILVEPSRAPKYYNLANKTNLGYNFNSSLADGAFVFELPMETKKFIKKMNPQVFILEETEISFAINYLAREYQIQSEGAGALAFGLLLRKDSKIDLAKYDRIWCFVTGGNIT